MRMQTSMRSLLRRVLAAAACAVALGSLAGAQSADAVTDAVYNIQAGDVLQVSVWREPELTADVLVRSDGGISFPLAGELKAAGNSVSQVKDMLTLRIQEYVPDAVVSVAVKAIGGNRVYVVGKVNRPGEYAFSHPIDVMQALSMAGGITPFSDRSNIRILRRVDGEQRALPFDYSDVASGKNLRTNVMLEAGDTVVVQ